MALFNFGKDKQKEGGDPTVMAYLEDAMRVKAPAMLIDPRKNELPCNIASFAEPEGTMNLMLHANLLAEKGAKVGIVVIVDNLRIFGWSKLHEVKPGHAVIEIPSSLELSERRKKQRAKLNPREGTTATLLSGLFDGIGITGLVDNISEGGVRVKVEKAIEIKTEKPITISSRTMRINQVFPIVKIAKIPRSVVTIECGGRLVYMDVASGVTFIGIAFEELKSEFARSIEAFVSGRNSPPPNSLPPRARRQKEEPRADAEPRPKDKEGPEDKDSKEKEQKEKAPKEKEPKEAKHKESHFDAPPPPQPEAEPQIVSDAPTEQPTGATEVMALGEQGVQGDQADGVPDDLPVRPAPTPLQRLKRKARTIVLCGTDETIIPTLEKIFQREGYGKVIVPSGIDGIFESAPQGGAGLIVLALDIPFDNCLGLAKGIVSQLSDPTPIVLISDDIPPGVGANLDAQSAGVSLLLSKSAKFDDALFTKLEELMGF
jgi:hypothetical protein